MAVKVDQLRSYYSSILKTFCEEKRWQELRTEIGISLTGGHKMSINCID